MFGVDYLFNLTLEEIRKHNYRMYVTSGIKSLIEVTARIGGAKDFDYPGYEEFTEPKPQKSAEEIIDDVINKCGLKMKGGDK